MKWKVNNNFAFFSNKNEGYIFDVPKNIIVKTCKNITDIINHFYGKEFDYDSFDNELFNYYNIKNSHEIFDVLCKNKIFIISSENSKNGIKKRTINPIFNCEYLRIGELFSNNVNGNFVFLGFPYEQSITNIGGTKFATRKIREYSSMVFDFDYMNDSCDVDMLIEKNTIKDLGDINGIIFDRNGEAFDFLHNLIFSIVSSGNIPIVLGGDHSISYPTLMGASKVKEIGVIHIDAHDDYMDFDVMDWRKELHHGNYLGGVAQNDSVKKIYSIGIRSYTSLYKDNDKIKVISKKNFFNQKVEFDKSIPYYISFDVDVIDPLLISGVGTPCPLGFTIDEITKLISIISQELDIIGIDIVEFIPTNKNETLTIISLILDFIKSIQKRRLK